MYAWEGGGGGVYLQGSDEAGVSEGGWGGGLGGAMYL